MSDGAVLVERKALLARKLDSADDWRALRALCNIGAHDYDDDDVGKTRFINEIAAQSARLAGIAANAVRYSREKLHA